MSSQALPGDPASSAFFGEGDQMRTVDQHLDRILQTIEPLAAHDHVLVEALGLPLLSEVAADVDLPGFDNSAMDGYAVVVSDLAGASPERPIELPVVGELAAGQTTAYAMAAGTAMRIMTGAPVPFGSDGVVPVEWTDGGIARVRIARAPAAGVNVRRRAEDVTAGEHLMDAGTVLGPRHIALLAAVGRSHVSVRPRPRVVVVSTGTELREAGHGIGLDQVYDANSHALAAAVKREGGIAYRVGIVPDDPEQVRQVLSDQLVRADMVITSGGVSKGAYDTVKEVLSQLGTVDFYEVAMQPGKPQGFGTIGEDATPIFTLPGNPVSAYVSFITFVAPAIRQMLGRQPVRRSMIRATLATGLSSMPGKRQFVRARLSGSGNDLRATPVGGHGSHLVGDLASADALVVVPEQVTALSVGDGVDVLDLDRDY